MDWDTVKAWVAQWEGRPLGFKVSTEPMLKLPNLEAPDFWEGLQ
jgi:hypothetical protein